MTKPLPPRPPRRLRLVQADRDIVVPGVGRFVIETVGNTSYSTGAFVYVHPENAIEALPGCLAFHVEVDDDLQVVWKQDARQPHPQKTEFTTSQAETAKALIEDVCTRDPTCFLFQVYGAIDPELRNHDRAVEDEKRSIQLFNQMQASTYRGPSRLSEDRIAEGIRRSHQRLASLVDTPRLIALRSARDAFRTWCKAGADRDRRPAHEIIASALRPEPVAMPSL